LIQYLLVGLLVALAVKNYLRRETVEPPRWLGTLLSADWKRALMTVTDSARVDETPSYSPSGKRIAYGCPGNYYDICTIKPGGGGNFYVTDYALAQGLPSWGSRP
jgi:hypothetical protein